MAAPIKAVLVAIIASAALFILTHLAFFFPFYMTVVVETFNLANAAANDNYVKYEYLDYSLENLRDRPMFEKAYDWDHSNIIITADKGSPGDTYGSAVGSINEDGTAFYYDSNGWTDALKPYRQRGEPVTVTVRAVYPFEVSMWGWTIKRSLPVEFRITTIGLKYYKDLPYDYLY